MNKVAVVILNWNGKDFLAKFLPSVVQYSLNAQIIVADNGSTDNSVDFIKTNFPTVGIIINDKNYGFAGGYNKALQQVSAKYYVLLNSDVEVTKDWINPIIKLMETDEKIAACQPKIKDYHSKEYFEYAGAAGGFIDKYGYPLCRGRIFDNIEKDHHQYNDVKEIFWASGACLFIKSELYHKIGGLDEYFFAHMEEIDLCWRLKNIGYKIMVCPQAEVFHVGGGTLNKLNPKKTFLNFRNSLLTLHKNLAKKERFKIILIRLLLDGLAGLKFLIAGKPQHTIAIIKAHFSFYKALKQNKAKQSKIIKTTLSGRINKSIVYSYFLKNVKTFTSFEK